MALAPLQAGEGQHSTQPFGGYNFKEHSFPLTAHTVVIDRMEQILPRGSGLSKIDFYFYFFYCLFMFICFYLFIFSISIPIGM